MLANVSAEVWDFSFMAITGGRSILNNTKIILIIKSVESAMEEEYQEMCCWHAHSLQVITLTKTLYVFFSKGDRLRSRVSGF